MPSDLRLRAHVDLILSSKEGAAVFPDNWEEVGQVEYLYRKNTILVREQDADRVIEALSVIPGEGNYRAALNDEVPYFQRQRVLAGVVRVTLSSALPSVPEVLDRLDASLGRGVATPDHVLCMSPYLGLAEPQKVPRGTVDPFPPSGLDARPGGTFPGPGCDGDGVFTTVIDTGLIDDAVTDHPWLTGVDGTPEDPYDPDGIILPYAGHGTFVTGCLRCAAPKVSVHVARAFDVAGADYESNPAPSLQDAFDRGTDILVFTFAAPTRLDKRLLTFKDLYERDFSEQKGLVIVAPAGNDASRRPMWPAAFRWVISVGALSTSWRERPAFSNFGSWVDIFAPGEDFVNAYAKGPTCAARTPLENTGCSTGWPSGVARHSPPPSSQG